MPRINIEEQFFTDVRFKALSAEVGELQAIGACVLMWRLAQKHWGQGCKPIPQFDWELSKFPEQVFKFGLAKKVEGGIYVSGSQQHFEWYQRRCEAAKIAGRASAAKRIASGQRGVDDSLTSRQPSSSSSSSSSSSEKIICRAALALRAVNGSLGKAFKEVPANLRHLEGRLKEGSSLQDLLDVAKLKRSEWEDDPKMRRYLRIETLYNATKFQSYLAEVAEAKANEGMYNEFL